MGVFDNEIFFLRFVHTWMPEEANKLIMENINKNIVDLDEYPAAGIIHNRCISMSEYLFSLT